MSYIIEEGRIIYGNETNGLSTADRARMEAIDYGDVRQLDDPDLVKIVRLRLLTDPGFPYWDVSYCHGELRDGTPVRVNLPVHQFKRSNLKGEIIAMAKAAGVYAKGMGLLDDAVISKLW